jgi:hypothetical protein
MSNAFNSIHRRVIYDAIERDFPELLKWFTWNYALPTDMVLSSGEVVAKSSTGIRQGDPLGPLFFCLGIQSALLRIGTNFPNHLILSYMDDITIWGEQSQMGEIIEAFKHEL